MRARIIVVVAAIALGFAAAFSVVKYMDSIRHEAIGKAQMVAVLTASSALPQGLSLDELRSRGLIVAKKVPKEFVPEGALSPRAELKGQVLAAPVVVGEALTSSRFAPPEKAGLSFTTPQGMVAVAMPAGDERAVANLIHVGDYVNVVVTFKEQDKKLGEVEKTVTLLKTVEVLAIGDVMLRPDTSEDEKAEKTKASRSDTNRTVTVAVPEVSAVELIGALEKDGKAWLTLVPSPDAPVVEPADLAKAEQTR